MIDDRELWACANEVLRQHGGQARMLVTERIRALALAGDGAGVATWQAIAGRIAQLGLGADRDHSASTFSL